MSHCNCYQNSPVSRREMLRSCANGFGAIALTALLGEKAFASKLEADHPLGSPS